jgi:hypothetical protein
VIYKFVSVQTVASQICMSSDERRQILLHCCLSASSECFLLLSKLMPVYSRAENITSDIITHGIPPIPSEKDPVKIWFQSNKNL